LPVLVLQQFISEFMADLLTVLIGNCLRPTGVELSSSIMLAALSVHSANKKYAYARNHRKRSMNPTF
jgi:hypothetical protein